MSTHQKKLFEHFHIISNVAFLVPIYFAYTKGFNLLALFITVSMLSSLWYHVVGPCGDDWWWDREGKTWMQTFLLWLDTVAADATIVYACILFFTFTPAAIHYYILTIGFSLALFFLFGKWPQDYERRHGLWHVCAAVMAMYVILIIG